MMRLEILMMLIAVALIAGCTTDAPRLTKVNGFTTAQTDKRFMGVKVWTSSKDVKTTDQKLEDIAVDKERREVELDLRTEERQSAAAFWFGVAMFVSAIVFAFTGYITKGWKFWGGLAAFAAILGATAWTAEHLVPLLKWPAYALAGAVVLWTMWKLKDFDLLERLRHSEPGEILGRNQSRAAHATSSGQASAPPAPGGVQ